jgi:hypothetical protein
MPSGKVKTSEFPVTNSIQPLDLIPIIKSTGNNNYKNYVVEGADFTVPNAVNAQTASLVNFYNIVNAPSLVSGSGQFTSSTDSPRFGQITASNLTVIGAINTPTLTVTSSTTTTLRVLNQTEFDGNVTATGSGSGSLIVNKLTVVTGTTLSGSNSIGDNPTETQSLIGSVIVIGNLTLTPSYSITADSGSFKVVSPLASASISYVTASTVLIDTFLQATQISSSQVTASIITSPTASFGRVDIKSDLLVTGSIHGIADKSISSSFSGTSLTSNFASNAQSASNATSASHANTASLAVYSITAGTASLAITASNAGTASYSTTSSYAATASYALNAVSVPSSSFALTASLALNAITASLALNAVSASYSAVTQVFSNSGSFVKTASNALDQNTSSYSNTASLARTSSYATSLATNAVLNNVTISNSTISGSLGGTASYAQNAGTASYVINGSIATSSYALTSSYVNTAQNALTASMAYSASTSQQSLLSYTSSNAVTASSYVLTSQTRQKIYIPNTFVSGNIITVNSTGTSCLASAANASSSNVLGIVEYSDYSGSGSGSFFSVVYSGQVNLTNLVPGSIYYLSDTIAGGYSLTPPTNPFSLNQPVFTAVNSTQALFYKVSPTLAATPTASFAQTSSYNLDTVTRCTFSSSNSFIPGQVISVTIAGNPQLALANTEQGANVVGVIETATTSSFTLIIAGKVTGLISPLIAGFTYYLSDTSAGTITNNRSSLMSSSVIKPVGLAITSTELVLFNQFSTNVPIGNALTAITASYVNNVPSSSYANIAGAAYTIIGSLPTNGNSIRDTYSASNSFTAGNVIGFDRTTNLPALCIADSYRNSDVIGIVESANSSSFTVVYSGKVFLPSGSFPTSGSLYYLSPTISGSYQSTVPTGAGQIVKSLMFSIDNASAVVSINAHAATASAAVSSSYAQNALVANYALTSNSASIASTAVGLTQNGSIFPLMGFITTGSATTSSVLYLKVNVNGTNYKIPLYGV